MYWWCTQQLYVVRGQAFLSSFKKIPRSSSFQKLTLAKWILEFLGIFSKEFLGIKVWIFTVNLDWESNDWEFLGIPNHNNFGSKNLEIPRNSQKFPEIPQKFQVYSQQDLEFLRIPWNSNSENQWLSLKSCKSENSQIFLRNSGNFQEFLGMFKNYWEF